MTTNDTILLSITDRLVYREKDLIHFDNDQYVTWDSKGGKTEDYDYDAHGDVDTCNFLEAGYYPRDIYGNLSDNTPINEPEEYVILSDKYDGRTFWMLIADANSKRYCISRANTDHDIYELRNDLMSDIFGD